MGVGVPGDFTLNKFVYNKNAPWFSTSDNEAVINPKRMAEEVAGGALVGGLFSAGNTVLSGGLKNDKSSDTAKKIRANAEFLEKVVGKTNNELEAVLKDAGITDIKLPKAPNWSVATVEEMNDYFEKSTEAYKKILKDERVELHDSEMAERYSIHNIDGHTRIYVDNDITRGEIQADTPKKIKQYILENYDKVKLKNGNNTGIVYITDRGASEYAYSRSTKSLAGIEKYDKWRMADNIDEMIALSINAKYENASHDRKDNILGFYRTPLEVQVADRVYNVEMVTAITRDYTEEFYDVVNLQLKKKGEPHPTLPLQSKNGRRGGNSPSMNSIRQGDNNVKLILTESQIKFASSLGLTVEYDESLDENGKIMLKYGKIIVSPYSSLDGFGLLRHEVTHWLKVRSPKEYQKFVDILKTEFTDEWESILG